MSRPIPSYLSTLPVPSNLIRYTWDDWSIEAIEEPLDQELIKAIEKLPRRAGLAYCIGSGEWLVQRLSPFLADEAPWLFLEACWAMLIDHHYSNYGDGTGWAEYADEQWGGAIKGPVNRAMLIVESAILEVQWHLRPEPGSYARYVATAAAQVNKLTQHVLEDRTAFQRWSEQIISRLQSLYPLEAGDNLGDVVPPEVVDPLAQFDPLRTESLVNAYLAGLNWTTNPFLSPPHAMVEIIEDDIAFQGKPYRFEIEADRKGRHRLRPL